MENNLEYSGIKCDTPDCGYRDDSVKFEDYKDWLNKPCPLCGNSLLTQEDFDHTVFMCNLLNGMVFPEVDPALEAQILADMELNGLTPEMLIDGFKGLPHEAIEGIFSLLGKTNSPE